MAQTFVFNIGDSPKIRCLFYNSPIYPETAATVLATPGTRTCTITDPAGTVTTLGAGTVVTTGVIEWQMSRLDQVGAWTAKCEGTATVLAATPNILITVTA